MDVERAQEIMDAAEMVSVMYQGDKVYIEHVDRTANKATVHSMDDPDTKQSVAVNELMEQ
ncbi:H-type small acid-soluble spore protein [Salipaludibacillus sp. HK11]|uniref:H-type small acid-soluble spore protein n=1 Tax=Salipaludibacillus sp. HK11 TaxID=3394320 RepID=UPI0039FD1346